MEFKEVQDEYEKVRKAEELVTLAYLKNLTSRQLVRIDLSNHYFFEKSAKVLLKLIKSHLISKKTIKSVVLQNCMLSAPALTKLLKLLKKYKSSISNIDLSNNRLSLNLLHTQLISSIFSIFPKAKSLNFKGNICSSSQLFQDLYIYEISLKELNLYDTSLSPEGLLTISKVLSLNKTISNLNLGFNSEAFENYVNVNTFACSISENSNIEYLTLSENISLGQTDNFMQLCKGMRNNRSLRLLNISGLGLGDSGVKIVFTHLLSEMPLPQLNLSNNNIQDPGLRMLIAEFPNTLTDLDLSYNTFQDNSSLISLSRLFKDTKSLRKFNISHSLEFQSLNESCVEIFCEAITENDSMAKLLCEGIKVAHNPDLICSKISKAIEVRKLSLTYKISAVNYQERFSSKDSVFSNRNSVKFISKAPSNVWNSGDSQSSLFTERRDYIDTPNQEPIIDTSRHFTFSTSFE